MAGVGVNQRAQIRMTDAEIAEFVRRSRTTTLATNGPTGTPHLVAMWYAVLDGELWFETKAKSQKVVNLRRNAHAAVMVESGKAYNTLKGVMVRGRANIIEDTEKVLEVLSLVSRRMAQATTTMNQKGGTEVSDPITQQARQLAAKRVVIRIHPEKWASWDHSKLPPGKY